LEYGTYACCMASRAAARSECQLMFAIAGNDSHFVTQCTWRTNIRARRQGSNGGVLARAARRCCLFVPIVRHRPE
jgi:hypothetical protein